MINVDFGKSGKTKGGSEPWSQGTLCGLVSTYNILTPSFATLILIRKVYNLNQESQH
jgi:hypothetical protein